MIVKIKIVYHVRNVIQSEKKYREYLKKKRDDYNRPKIKKILDRIMESIRYNEQPNFKEKGLRQVLVVIARDCIENNKENVVCDGLIGNPELVKYGYILEEWDVKIRFEKFWMWYKIEHKGGPVNIKSYIALKTFKEILYLEDIYRYLSLYLKLSIIICEENSNDFPPIGTNGPLPAYRGGAGS
ncbi:hypothetical protein RclHR1_26150001 [Rhizophagus clarus]|uniref:Uncharacterized protein n=1 Tax=Rhizophagus clarus TaxID=94130 RepID=A0A2Z6R0N3_9GLOM|nr:hypothetical protein RclHR1_26150001 [Rhizophagus clarus]